MRSPEAYDCAVCEGMFCCAAEQVVADKVIAMMLKHKTEKAVMAFLIMYLPVRNPNPDGAGD